MTGTRRPSSYDADIVMTVALAQKLIGEQFPELRSRRVAAFGEGWDNWVYRVDDWIFRFPRRRVAVSLTEREMAILPRLSSRLPRPIPHPIYFGTPSPEYPWPFFGYRSVPGTPVAEMAWDPERRSASAPALAEFLQALQRVPAAEAMAWGAGEPTLGRLNLGPLKERFEMWLSAAVDRGLAGMDAPWVAEFRESETPPASLGAPVLVHGDLNFKNVLLDSCGQLAGVVDWGDVHLGHPAEDWMFAAGYLPRVGQALFRTLAGAADDGLWQAARAVSIYVNVIVLVSASDMGRPADVAEAQWQLANLAATRDG